MKIKDIIKLNSIKEITINDIGLLHYLSDKNTKIKINIGRILLSVISYSVAFGKMNKSLTDMNINSLEVDALIPKEIIKAFKRIHFYTPFSYLAHTRNCVFYTPKGCSCKNEFIKLKSQIFNNLYINSNAYFAYEKHRFLGYNIKRIIYYS
ncbi:MAG: hypothetical protein ACP5IO_06755 [Elusimicrobiales bacterium]